LSLTMAKMRQNLIIFIIYHVIFQYFNLRMLEGGFIQQLQPAIMKTMDSKKGLSQEDMDKQAIK